MDLESDLRKQKDYWREEAIRYRKGCEERDRELKRLHQIIKTFKAPTSAKEEKVEPSIMAISDFDPRLIDVLRDAATKEIILPMTALGAANNLRQTFYRLRKAMREEKHPLVSLVNRVSILVIMQIKATKQEISFSNYKITPVPKEPYEVFIRLYPVATKYDKLLEEAGYVIPPPPNLE